MKIETLRKEAGREEIDYLFLISKLRDYSRPRDKISDWLKSGELIRVKKGLYVFGKEVAQEPFSLEVLANLIYGPSAISLTYALFFYGLIPERVSTITSITNKRFKEFFTPVGHFSYYYISSKKFSVGIELQSISNNQQFLIATPEKSLCDQLILMDKSIKFTSEQDVNLYLFQDLRIDQQNLKNFSLNQIININKIYQSKKINQLIKFLRRWKK